MAEKTIIFGKSSCPFCQDAKASYGEAAEYIDVGTNRGKMREMLGYSGGVARVPVIVEDGEVTIGYGGT